MRKARGSLEHYDDPALYDAGFADRHFDVDYFADLAASCEGPVLEYGCGTGRVTRALLERGCFVTGVDASPPMLHALRDSLSPSQREQVELVRGDARRVQLRRRYPLAMATFNLVGHLETRQDLARFLARVREHLAPGGRLVFDVPIPAPEEVEADPEETYRVPPFRHPQTGEWIEQTERYDYDLMRQLLTVQSEYRVRGQPDSLCVPLTLRQWYPQEIQSLLIYEGFDLQVFADYTTQPGVLAEDTLVIHAWPQRASGPEQGERGQRSVPRARRRSRR